MTKPKDTAQSLLDEFCDLNSALAVLASELGQIQIRDKYPALVRNGVCGLAAALDGIAQRSLHLKPEPKTEANT